MFTLFTMIIVNDTIRIPPNKFGDNLSKVALDELRTRYEGAVNEELGYVIAVTEITVEPIGRIIPGDGATYHKVKFTIVTYNPMLQEIAEGEVVEVEDFGAFVRIGPIDTLLHVSQVVDDFVTCDERQGILIAKESRRTLKQGDQVRARITAVSFAKGGSSGKIGITMRQPFLGKLEWIQEDVKKTNERVRKEAKVTPSV